MTKPDEAERDFGNVYYNPDTGYYYYGYCIELIYKINSSMKVRGKSGRRKPAD